MCDQIATASAAGVLDRPSDRHGTDADGHAMRGLYDGHADVLLRYVFRLTGDRSRAEDVVQETLLRAWRHLASTGGERPVRSWLFTVARNIVIDQSRTARYRNEVMWSDPADVADYDGPDEVVAALDRLLVSEALSRLPDVHRDVLTRAYYLGWTAAQIAEDLQIAEGTVKSRLHYALRKLRVIFNEMGIGTINP